MFKVTQSEDKNRPSSDKLLSACWLTVPGTLHDPTATASFQMRKRRLGPVWGRTLVTREQRRGAGQTEWLSIQVEDCCVLVLTLPSSVTLGKPHDLQSLNFFI